MHFYILILLQLLIMQYDSAIASIPVREEITEEISVTSHPYETSAFNEVTTESEDLLPSPESPLPLHLQWANAEIAFEETPTFIVDNLRDPFHQIAEHLDHLSLVNGMKTCKRFYAIFYYEWQKRNQKPELGFSILKLSLREFPLSILNSQYKKRAKSSASGLWWYFNGKITFNYVRPDFSSILNSLEAWISEVGPKGGIPLKSSNTASSPQDQLYEMWRDAFETAYKKSRECHLYRGHKHGLGDSFKDYFKPSTPLLKQL